MSELLTKQRVVAAALMVGMGAVSVAGCSGKAPANNKEVTGKPYESAGPSLPPMFMPGDIMHCQTNPGAESRPVTNAGFQPGVTQAISRIFNVPEKEMQEHGRAFLATCDLSMTGSMISQAQPIPEVAGDPEAAGKLCIVWEALYMNQAEAKADVPLDTFFVVCDTAHAEVHPSPTATASQTTQA